MAKDHPTTREHRGPMTPDGGRRRPALICAFPRSVAIALPVSSTTVGRAWLEAHGLADREVSSEHVVFDRRGGALGVADAGSRNGTWVNGARLSPHDRVPLDDGAVLRVGRTLFVYREELVGGYEPSPPLLGLTGPYGLRGVERFVAGLSEARPGNVLVEGETGVGKELVAHAIAEAFGRARPFGAVNVAGVARGVFESQLFGHVAGAFSDARRGSPGIVLAHAGGTVFLDEIGELDLDLQVKLLRLLENREVLPVGAERAQKADVLLIAATNRVLEELVEEGAFRRDLFARLLAARVRVPSLHERAEDVFAIAQALAARADASLAEGDVEVEAVERLVLEPWPNNVRELDAVLASVRRVDAAPGLRLWALEEVLGSPKGRTATLTEEAVGQAMGEQGGNVTAAARTLGVTRGRLLRFLRRKKGE